MNKSENFIFQHLQCLKCRSKVEFIKSSLRCKKCGERYPIIDDIPDFYPSNNIFSPGKINLKDKYEGYGEKVSRPNSFQNLRRKRLTVDMVEGESLLEIGTAEGWMTEKIVPKVKNVVSCDIALSYLKRAKARGIMAQFMRVDAHFLPFEDETFDSVLITEVLEHVYSPYRVLEEISRVLTNQGTLIISVPNNMSFSNIFLHLLNKEVPDYDAHLNFYDMHSIKRLLSFVGFSIRDTKSVFIYLPLLKTLFYSHKLQNILMIFLKNFGDKVILKAVKSQETLWDKI